MTMVGIQCSIANGGSERLESPKATEVIMKWKFSVGSCQGLVKVCVKSLEGLFRISLGIV